MTDVYIDKKFNELKIDGERIWLTKREFNLFCYLFENKDHIVSANLLLTEVWGYLSDIESRVISIYISYLRKKLIGNGVKIITHVGLGYQMKVGDL